jgi:chloramphenicol 3-O-phosphotransferase
MSSSSPGRTVFLTGPTGAGKTTTGMLWATTRPTPTWFFDWDAVRNDIVQADRLRGLSEMDLDAQYQLAAEVIAASVEASAHAGVDCIVAGAWAHRSAVEARYATTWDCLRELDPLVVVLLPSLEVCVERHAGDGARSSELGASRQAVSFWHPRFAAWADEPNAVVLDTSDWSPAETAAELERLVVGLGSDAEA